MCLLRTSPLGRWEQEEHRSSNDHLQSSVMVPLVKIRKSPRTPKTSIIPVRVLTEKNVTKKPFCFHNLAHLV